MNATSPSKLSAARYGRSGPRDSTALRQTSREAVLEHALRLIDSEGLDALTMRRLADEVGIPVMSLYGYVRTKVEILEGVSELALSSLGTTIDSEAPWDDQLAEAVRNLRAGLRRHPAVVELILANVVPPEIFDDVRETLLAILAKAGFSLPDAVYGMGSLVTYALGYAVAEGARNHPRRNLANETNRLQQLSSDRYPHLKAAAEVYPDNISDESFERGLTNLLNGLRPWAVRL
jgi:AcrR family transcriptional regulator